jgi:hypothetical protein
MAQADASNAASSGGKRGQISGVLGCAALALLFVGSFVPWYHQSSPETVARQYLSEQGVATGDLELVGRDSYSPFTPAVLSTTKVEFRVKGTDASKKQSVELFRIVYFLPWRVTGLKEVKQ